MTTTLTKIFPDHLGDANTVCSLFSDLLITFSIHPYRCMINQSVSKLLYEEEIEDEVLPMMNEENYLFVAKES
jgi:hypothetical protein